MKLTEQLNMLINEQITHERKNNAIYLQIASYFEDLELTKIADFFFKQAKHELGHAQKLIDHLNNRLYGKVLIGAVPAPEVVINTISDIGELYITTEVGTTRLLENIYRVALDSNSFIDLPVLADLLNEQVEEEDLANKFATQIRLCNDMVLFNNTLSL